MKIDLRGSSPTSVTVQDDRRYAVVICGQTLILTVKEFRMLMATGSVTLKG